MGTEPESLSDRTFQFARRVARLCRSLPATREGRIVGDQLFRAATSVAANYRASQRARSHAAFIAKLNIVLEEADECMFWLEFLQAEEIFSEAQLQGVRQEAGELVSILVTSLRRARAKNGDP